MRKIGVGLLTLAIFVLQGCAHSGANKKLDEKLSQEEPVTTRADLRSQVSQLIATAPGLSTSQRSQLSSLSDSTREKTNEIRAQSLKLRSALVKDLVSTDYDSEEVALIKDRMKSLEEKRLSVLFDAVERANTILGHQAPENQQMIHEFLAEPHGLQTVN